MELNSLQKQNIVISKYDLVIEKLIRELENADFFKNKNLAPDEYKKQLDAFIYSGSTEL